MRARWRCTCARVCYRSRQLDLRYNCRLCELLNLIANSIYGVGHKVRNFRSDKTSLSTCELLACEKHVQRLQMDRHNGLFRLHRIVSYCNITTITVHTIRTAFFKMVKIWFYTKVKRDYLLYNIYKYYVQRTGKYLY